MQGKITLQLEKSWQYFIALEKNSMQLSEFSKKSPWHIYFSNAKSAIVMAIESWNKIDM